MAEDAYPPSDHVLRHLGLAIRRGARGEGSTEVRGPSHSDVLGRGGSLGAATLGVAIDVLGGNVALEALAPDWGVTSTLELHLLRRSTRDYGVSGGALRAGRTNVVIDAEVHDGGDGPLAVGSMTFTRLPRRADTPLYDPPEAGDYAFGEPRVTLGRPLFERIGCRVLDAAAGRIELDLTPYVRNSVGGLQGGMVVALADAAAEGVAADRLGEGVATVDVLVHFLALGRVGPIRTRTRWLAGDADEAQLRVELVDLGQDERLVSVASLRLARLRA